jgi:chromosome segregation ATPase
MFSSLGYLSWRLELLIFCNAQLTHSKAKVQEEEAKRQELVEAEEKIALLEDKKHKIERQMVSIESEQKQLHEREKKLHVGNDDPTSSHSSIAEEVEIVKKREALEEEKKDLEQALVDVKDDLHKGKEEAEQIAQAHALLLNDVKELRAQLGDLRALNDSLNASNLGQSTDAAKIQSELQEIQASLEKEARAKRELEEYILKLKADMYGMLDDKVRQELVEEDKVMAQEQPGEVIGGEIDNEAVDTIVPFEDMKPLKGQRVSNDLARKEKMQLELDKLKKKLQKAKEGKEMLETITHKMEEEMQEISQSEEINIPVWIRSLNSDDKSKTIRMKIAKVQENENPEELTFK